MSSVLRRLINRFYPNDQFGHRVTILGLDYSGKTTLLYLLKTGGIVQTISTIGFNVETVDVTTSSGKSFRMTGWDVGTGCGLVYLYGLLRVYIAQSDALIWVVDSCDRNRLPESVQALKDILSPLDSEATVGSETLPPKNLPTLILANKSDRPEAMTLDEIRINFAKITHGRLVSVQRTACREGLGLESSGLPEAFDWLLLALDIFKSGKSTTLPPKDLEPQIPNPRSQTSLAQKLESWLTRVESDFPPDEFLSKFRSFTLPSWDHYTHIRIAYVMLTKYGRKDGKDMIFKGLETYISVSPQTKGRSFHVTMTYFWIQIVHFGIRNMPASPEPTPASSSEPRLASPDDFPRFLLINPHVADGNLWSDYYTKDVMMSPKAKLEMVLPDRKPLPNLVIRDAITTFGA